MPVSSAACWCLAGYFWTTAGGKWGKWSRHKHGDQFASWLSIYSETPAGVSCTKKHKKLREKQKHLWNSLTDKSKALCLQGRSLRETLQMESICWRCSRFSSTSLRLSSCQNASCVVLGGSRRLCSVFPGAFQTFLLSSHSKGCLLPRCLNLPAQFAQPPLPPHREPFICVLEGRFLVVSWTLSCKCLLRKNKKENCDWIFPAPYYNKHSKNKNLSSGVMSFADLWPLRVACIKAFPCSPWSLEALRRTFQKLNLSCFCWAELLQLQSVFYLH